MSKKLSIKIKGEELKGIVYIPHPEISLVMKEYMQKNPIEIEDALNKRLIVNDVKHHSMFNNEPMRANMLLSRNVRLDYLMQLERKVLSRLNKIIKLQ